MFIASCLQSEDAKKLASFYYVKQILLKKDYINEEKNEEINLVLIFLIFYCFMENARVYCGSCV
ncbi:MAG: hypothetical protein MJ227_04990, partial [Bacilli bacterium]|nr:hypothetical protein [Bacilli bacterium]